MISAASEFSSGKRPVFMAEGDAMETVPIKRRRREPSSASLGCDINQQGEQQQQLLAGQTTATTVKRSSKFRGVSRHRWTGRYEAHLWDKGSWNPTRRKKGKQVYLGAYDEEESAAKAYDLAALKYWGPSTFTNFPVSEYEKEIEIMKTVTKEEYLASLRRRSSGFSRGVSKYRGVARHHHNGRWEARIGGVFGNKYLYLGTYSTQEEAAHAYDIAAIEYRGINAVTNFDLSTYNIRWLKPGADPYPQTYMETKTILDSQPMTSFLSNNVTPRDQTTGLSIFNSNPFAVEALEIPEKQDILQINNTPIFSPACTKSSSSSPTALSVLLRSSVFKELVEKNLNNTADKETEENDTKNFQISTKDEIGEEFYNEIGISTPVQYVSYQDVLYDLELDKNALSPQDKTANSLSQDVGVGFGYCPTLLKLED